MKTGKLDFVAVLTTWAIVSSLLERHSIVILLNPIQGRRKRGRGRGEYTPPDFGRIEGAAGLLCALRRITTCPPFLLSEPHENGHFLPFFIIHSQRIEQTTTLLFILKILWCSNNLMQKMTSKSLCI